MFLFVWFSEEELHMAIKKEEEEHFPFFQIDNNYGITFPLWFSVSEAYSTYP